VMARNVVSLYPQLEKMASLRGPEGEIARFYLSWAAEMEKKAGLVDMGIKGFRAAKAGIGAAIPKSSKSLMGQAVKASEKGLEVAPRQSVGQAVKGSLAQSNALQQAGGGSIRRGQQLAKADPGLLQSGKVMHPGTPPAAVGGGAPMAGKPAAPAAQVAPAGAPAAGAQAPAGKKAVNWKHVGIGAATVGGTAYALSKMMGSGEPQQSFVN